VPDLTDTSGRSGGRPGERTEMCLEPLHRVLRRSQRGLTLSALRGPDLLVEGADHVAHGRRQLGGDSGVGDSVRRPSKRSETVLEGNCSRPRHRPPAPAALAAVGQ
jgi:hypothetical protein